MLIEQELPPLDNDFTEFLVVMVSKGIIRG